MTSETYDIEGLAKGLELEYVDITDLYISYIDEIDKHCQKIKETFYKKDFLELKNETHNVKGVAANLLIKDVFDEASSFEKLLKDGNFTGTNEHVKSLLIILIKSQEKVVKSFSNVNVFL